MFRRWFVAVFGCALLLACGDGGASARGSVGSERPLANTEQAPPSNEQAPVPNDQRPVANDQQAPVNAQQPLPPASTSSGGASGDSKPDPNPGKKCSTDDQCAGCKDLCQTCLCGGVARATCVAISACN